jgi:DNA mismatch endonuclease (patch repair protein)
MWYVTKVVIGALRKTNAKLTSIQPYRTKQEPRSFNMSMIRSKNTVPELILRKALWARGYRYRISPNNIVGKPDIVFISQKVAVFCDSVFWHGINLEKTLSRIKTNKDYWRTKLSGNVNRDKEVTEALVQNGWDVVRVSDKDIKDDIDNVLVRIESILRSRSKYRKTLSQGVTVFGGGGQTLLT